MLSKRIGGLLALIYLCFLGPLTAQDLPYPPKPSPYSASTAVVCNRNIPESLELARYYAEARAIPEDNIVVIDCPTVEEITREDYERLIEKPLRSAMLRRNWWIPSRDPNTGTQDIKSSIKIVTLMYGIPLKIKEESAGADGTMKTTAASIDSELTILSQPGLTHEGPLSNPYFQSDQSFSEVDMPILLVGRLDGPTPQICKRIIDDTILAETNGVWGNGYVDLSEQGAQGNEWLMGAAENLRRVGVTVTLDRYAPPFAANYPYNHPAFYFGWYEPDASESFQNPDFRFQQGAIAYHIHPKSCAKLHTTREHWAGPLLDKGAAAVLANVDQPSLEICFQPDIFTNRLCRGYTLVESAYASVRVFSWMGVVLGDPLYTPFPAINQPLNPSHYTLNEENGEDEMAPYKVMRLTYARWGEGKALPEGNLFYRLELASARLPRGEILEHIALGFEEQGDEFESRIQYMRAKSAFEKPADKLRMDLHLAELELLKGNRLAAFKVLRDAEAEYSGIPEVGAVQAMRAIVQQPQQ